MDADQTSRRATVSLSGGDQGRSCWRTAAPTVAAVPTAATAARNTYWVTVAKIWSGTPSATPSATARPLAAREARRAHCAHRLNAPLVTGGPGSLVGATSCSLPVPERLVISVENLIGLMCGIVLVACLSYL